MAKHNFDGAKAEESVAEYLKKHNYKILEQNWKTKWCEIDLVAKKENCIYFVEVKYRSSSDYGGGFDYITPAKQQKMNLAARSWSEINNWNGEQVLSAAEVSGSEFDIEFIEQI